jgi:D-Tyr-tRNAtyr deacylase
MIDKIDPEYREWIDAARNAVAADREKYEARLEALPEMREEAIRRVVQSLATVTCDDTPEKSHWIVAQCRVFLDEVSKMEKFISEFDRRVSSISEFDNLVAKQEEGE